jgi:hypothetical protein
MRPAGGLSNKKSLAGFIIAPMGQKSKEATMTTELEPSFTEIKANQQEIYREFNRKRPKSVLRMFYLTALSTIPVFFNAAVLYERFPKVNAAFREMGASAYGGFVIAVKYEKKDIVFSLGEDIYEAAMFQTTCRFSASLFSTEALDELVNQSNQHARAEYLEAVHGRMENSPKTDVYSKQMRDFIEHRLRVSSLAEV